MTDRDCVSSLSSPNFSAIIRTTAGTVHLHGCECDRVWFDRDLAKCGGLIPLHDAYDLAEEFPGHDSVVRAMRESPWWFTVPSVGSMHAHRGEVTWSAGDQTITGQCTTAHGTIGGARALEATCE